MTASSGEGHLMLALLAGQAFLDANGFEEAVNSFLDALRAVNSIK